MTPMTHELRKKIQLYIKNKLDIATLIDGVQITGENFNGAIITRLFRLEEDLSNCSFANAVIGTAEGEVNFSGSNLTNCNFRGVVFPGRVLFRNVRARGANLSDAYLPYMEYQGADFRSATFCDAVIRIGSRQGKGAKFDKNLFRALARFWGVPVTVAGENIHEEDTNHDTAN